MEKNLTKILISSFETAFSLGHFKNSFIYIARESEMVLLKKNILMDQNQFSFLYCILQGELQCGLENCSVLRYCQESFEKGLSFFSGFENHEILSKVGY